MLRLLGYDVEGRRQRAVTNNNSSAVFKYGRPELEGDEDSYDDIVVHYWSAPSDKNANNTRTRGDLGQQERQLGVTASHHQLHQHHQQLLETQSLSTSSVHSAAVVLTIAGIFVAFTLTAVMALFVFWRKSNTVFALQKCEQRDIDDDEDADDADDVGTESDSDGDSRSRGRSRCRHNITSQSQWMRLRCHDDDEDNDDVRSASSDVVPHRDFVTPSLASATATVHGVLDVTTNCQMSRSLSETLVSDVSATEQLTSTPNNATKCRLTLSRSTTDWTALYQQN